MATSAFVKYGTFSFLASSGYPVPSVSLKNNFERDSTGKLFGSTLGVTLEGQLYSSSGDRGFLNLLNLESGLRNAFTKDGGYLNIGCSTGTSTTQGSITGCARVVAYNANKTNNNWSQTIDYTIELEIPIKNTGSGIFAVTQVQDDWTLEPLDDVSFLNSPINLSPIGGGSFTTISRNKYYPSYRITRTIGAVGKSDACPSGVSSLQNAKDWVNYRLQQAPSYTGVIDSSLSLFNFMRSISASETDGNYRITDTWMGIPTSAVSSGAFIETFTIENSLDQSFLRTVTINGTIKGLELFNSGNIYDSKNNPYLSGGLTGTLADTMSGNRLYSGDTKFENALSGYKAIQENLYERVSAAIITGNPIIKRYFYRDENPLNPIPYSLTEGFNPPEGTITYSWVYNNRPLRLISGSISETLTVDDSYATQQFANIFVLGRRLGPILQDLGTIGTNTRTVTFEVVMMKPPKLANMSFPVDQYTAITGVVESFHPSKLFTNTAGQILSPIKCFTKRNTENWTITEGRFVKVKEWEYTKCIE